MYEQITVPRATPVITPEQLAAFGRFDVPQSSPVSEDYLLLQLFIEAATDKVESLSSTAQITETVVLTFDYFPGQADPRNLLAYELSYAYNTTPWWWSGFPTKDSIELVRRPVQSSASPVVVPVVTYNDTNGDLQTFDPSNYTCYADKITLNVNCAWPLTDRRQDCIQITYQAGFGNDPSDVPARLQLADLFLANHFWENRSIVSVEPTTQIYGTMCSMLSSYRSMRIPR